MASSQALSARTYSGNLRASHPGRSSARGAQQLYHRHSSNDTSSRVTLSGVATAGGGLGAIPMDMPTRQSYPYVAPLQWMDTWVKRLPQRVGEQFQSKAAGPSTKVVVDVDKARLMLEREGYALLDMRSSKAFNKKHIVKPAKCTVNVPCTRYPGEVFVDGVGSSGLAKSSKILVLDHSGTINRAAADTLAKAGYTNVKALEGGFEGWMARLTSSGRK